jgi:Spy/CpxP family protein refolding chaperone
MKKHMYRIALSGVLAAGLTLCGAQAFAQDNQPPDTAAGPSAQGPGGGMGRRGMDPDRMLAQMTKRYKLSADQQSQIKPILADQQQQMQALRGDSTMSREDKMTKIQSMRSDTNSKIEAVLNDDQKKQFEADQQRREQRMQERMQQGGGAGQGAPPPQQ